MINEDTKDNAGYRADAADRWPEKRKHNYTSQTVVA